MVIESYPPARCGGGDATSILARNLARMGAEVSVVTSAYYHIPFHSGNPTVLPLVESWSLTNARKALKAVLETRPDVVHFQWPSPVYAPFQLFDFLPPMVKLFKPSTRLVITFHEPLVGPDRLQRVTQRLFGRLCLPATIWACVCFADGIIVVAESYREALRAASRRMRRIPIKLVSNAANIPASQLRPAQLAELRAQMGLKDGTLVLSHFGFTRPDKGFECLFSILELLRQRGISAQLVVLGYLSDSNPYHRSLLSRAAEGSFRGQIRVMGHLDPVTVANWLAASDACIFPFTQGLHPKAASILAATIQGVFTVTTSTARRGLDEAENVYYALPSDVEEMAVAVRKYAGRRVPRGSFPWRTPEQVAEDNLQLYEQLLSHRKAGGSVQGR
jgi:glycosyltransferase involved in cell wall biosynthesis